MQSGSYTLHLRRSTDRGLTFSADLRTLSSAKNPALAINEDGLVGFAYQRVTGTGSTQRWETHLETISNVFSTSDDHILSTTPSNNPTPTFLPYLGDYIHMVAHGKSLFGVFSANNTPDAANFPLGVTYQRNHDFATHQLFAVNGTTQVNPSVDPFFSSSHRNRGSRSSHGLRNSLGHPFTRFTDITLFTPFTRFTQVHAITTADSVHRIHAAAWSAPRTRPGAIHPVRQRRVHSERLDVANFEVLAGAAEELAEVGITGLHQLATADPVLLAGMIGWSRDHAAEAVRAAQRL